MEEERAYLDRASAALGLVEVDLHKSAGVAASVLQHLLVLG